MAGHARTIVEDAVRAARGARLELTVAARTTEGLSGRSANSLGSARVAFR
jgi:hypothetical protein